jgi:hypothetical protein
MTTLVTVRGSRRQWTVLEDNGDTLLIEWSGIRRAANREDILSRLDSIEVNPTCGSCGADIGESATFPWHLADEDCRAVRTPGGAVT